jgi:DNA-binding CsgD family transcriptional regulator
MHMHLIGRDDELAAAEALLLGAGGSMVLLGEPGIGKSALLRAVESRAREADRFVVSARPVEAEMGLPYIGLRDLFEPLFSTYVAELTQPLRQPLDAALLRERIPDTGVDRLAVHLATLEVLRTVVVANSLLVVVLDDLQWLDVETRAALSFALRRMPAGVAVIAAARMPDGDAEPVADVRAALPRPVKTVRLSELPDEAVTRLLVDTARGRLGGDQIRELVAVSSGNPLVAEELAEAAMARGSFIEPGEVLQVPERLRSLIAGRLFRMPERVRRTLLAAALAARPTPALLTKLRGSAALQDVAVAEAMRVAHWGDGRLVFRHPLLAAGVIAESTLHERRAVHADLALAAEEVTERALHLALSAPGPDAAIVETLVSAVHAARSRGAPAVAARLAEHALRLAPADDAKLRVECALTAAEDFCASGDWGRSRSLLTAVLPTVPGGTLRARLLTGLGDAWGNNTRQCKSCLVEALGEQSDPEIEALVRVGHAACHTAQFRFAEARAELDRAVALRGGLLDAHTAWALCHLDAVRGTTPLETTALRALENADRSERPVEDHPEFFAMLCAVWADDLEQADQQLHVILERCRSLGDYGAVVNAPRLLAEVAIRRGAYRRALDLCHAPLLAFEERQFEQGLWYVVAHAEAFLGQVAPAHERASKGAARARDCEDLWYLAKNLLVLGFIGVSLGDYRGALIPLRELAGHLRHGGVGHPGVFPRWHGDAVEALCAQGAIGEAEEIASELRQQAEHLNLGSSSALADRCAALCHAARGDVEAAVASYCRAIQRYSDFDLPFEQARTLLGLGVVERRRRRKAAARAALAEAFAIFESLETPLWASRAASELERAGAPPAPVELSPTESRVAQLAATGCTNREIADQLFLSLKTIEANLSRVYRKLGVRSRTELARRVHASAKTPP